jgi:cation:H+ antiporter
MTAPLMSTPIAILLFATSLAATLAASGLFARRLDRLGGRLGIHEAVLGLLTALAADAPELSSGVTAMVRGEPGVGVGVLLGSNVFNIAAMVGVSALLSGGVALARPALALEGAFALFAAAVAGGVLYGVLPPWSALVLLVVWTVPYLVLLARGTFHGPLPPRPRSPSAPIRWPGARAAAGHTAQVSALFVRELPAVAVIVVGSVGMVDSAVTLAGRYDMPKSLVGLLVLATATSLPNAYTAIRLGLAGRGAALVSETLNSNTINLAAGLVLASVFVTISHGGFVLDYVWMLVETVAMLALVGRRGGAGRGSGALLIASYVAYVTVRAATA